MRFKPLVMLSSLFVLITLIVCVSVYAYNAYTTAGRINDSTVNYMAAINTYGLTWQSTKYKLRTKFGNLTIEEVIFPKKNNVGDFRSRNYPDTKDGHAYAYVSGLDPQGRPHRTDDTSTFTAAD